MQRVITVLLFDDVPIVSAGRWNGQNCDGVFEAKTPIGTRSAGAQVHQPDQRTLVRRELATAVTLVGDDEHRHRLDPGVRQVECGRTAEPTRLLCQWVETSNTSPNGTGASCAAHPSTSHDQWP
ncbi:hypothetical protein SGFS_007540 [Streptomyces graminofaciens]|uniref:Uncharacterized protein n=1 Tax=Streptomyces graminofaciens TaxID=68212 RepID=A0ABM7F168_9ACTN|nr:hypothetical protein SGFS_007540 [Streptomyces graminofaciens]